MKDGKDKHPCNTCIYFAWWDSVKTEERGLSVDIPICGYRIYTLALGKCECYEFKSYKNNFNDEMTKGKYENPDSPLFVG